MNPLPVAWAFARANGLTNLLFLVLIALAVALGVAITAQERTLREGSARAADPFELVIAGPGSQTEIMFNVVYLRPSAIELLPSDLSSEILAEERATLVAPVAFGDNHEGIPIVGTTADLLTYLAKGSPLDGRMFATAEESVIGSEVLLGLGDEIEVGHGAGHYDEGSHGQVDIVGRMPATGTAWDAAIIVPIEFNWLAHNMTTGHAPGSEQIGPPFDADFIPGVPAFVVVSDSPISAYGLRQKYRTDRTTAFFPAEVLVQLYAILRDVRSLMSVLTLATQGLVVAAILSGVVALIQLYRTRLAVLRALGATRGYVLAVMWTYVMGLIVGGALLGLALGYGGARVLSAILSAEAGITLVPSLGPAEFALIGGLLLLGAVAAVLPAWVLFRKPPVAYLR